MGKRRVIFSRGECNFYRKDKLKSVIFMMTKKVYKQKCFSLS